MCENKCCDADNKDRISVYQIKDHITLVTICADYDVTPFSGNQMGWQVESYKGILNFTDIY
jgi:hypothetical protein